MASYPTPNRAVFTVTRSGDGWAVEHDGSMFDPSEEREEVMASAVRRARGSNDAGRPSQIRVQGEPGFYGR